MTTATPPPTQHQPDDAHVLAERLRSAAAWLELAADALGSGNTTMAAGMAELGLFAADCAPDLIRGTAPAVAA
ncbi:MAG: hypothetical protein H0V93_09115 [Euzebyales bacterium]|nr:hypothetical protein [Euzebyales bacterium]